MKQKNQTEQFKWSCGYEQIFAGGQREDVLCSCHSTKLYATKEDAARAGLRHKAHPHSVGVYSTVRGYVGLAVGINFNAAKVIGSRNEED